MVTNFLRDYELGSFFLVCKAFYGLSKDKRFWAKRIACRLQVTLNNKNENFIEAYQNAKWVYLHKRGYQKNDGASFESLRLAVDIDFKLTDANIRTLLRPSGPVLRKQPNITRAHYDKLFKELPDIWYAKRKLQIIRQLAEKDITVPTKVELEEYIRLGDKSDLETFLTNLLFGVISFEKNINRPSTSQSRFSFSKPGSQNFLNFLLSHDIVPHHNKLVTLFKNKHYLSYEEATVLKTTFEKYNIKLFDKFGIIYK